MNSTATVHPDDVRSLFSHALSRMYQAEVPLYGTLLELVADINTAQPQGGESLERIGVERHGAVRLGTAQELATMRRLFAVLGMQPVGYYDLSVAGVPVHATAFRPVGDAALARNPFRVFTSLLRLELIDDAALRAQAAAVLAQRRIFTPACLELIDIAERDGGLDAAQAERFVAEALHTFRWHHEATVSLDTYRQLRAAHPLIADVVCFKGPHINHLTPRVLDIDAAQAEMLRRGIRAKDSIEGPPRRAQPILLRQTSFLALNEAIRFVGEGNGDAGQDGTHTARFGEIEQRGCALTRKGRALYDTLLADAQAAERAGTPRAAAMAQAFARFPDDLARMHAEGLAFVRHVLRNGVAGIEPLVYEDFLPVSAAGIFRSNLGSEGQSRYESGGNRAAFEAALGASVSDEFALYEKAEADSLAQCAGTPE